MDRLKPYHDLLYQGHASKEQKHEQFQHFSRASKSELEAVNRITEEFNNYNTRVRSLRMFYSDLVTICEAIPDTEKAKAEAAQEGLKKDNHGHGGCDDNNDTPQLLRIKKKPPHIDKSVAALSDGSYPALVEMDCLDYDSCDALAKLVQIYPLTHQEAIRMFLHTQGFAVFQEKVRKKKGGSKVDGMSGLSDSSEDSPKEPEPNCADTSYRYARPQHVHVTLEAAHQFVDRLTQMVEEEGKQTVMLSDLVRIYQEEERVYKKTKEENLHALQDEHHHNTTQHGHSHSQPLPPKKKGAVGSGRGWLAGSGILRKSLDRVKKEEEPLFTDEKSHKETLEYEHQVTEVTDSLRRSQERLRLLQLAKCNLEEVLRDHKERTSEAL